MRWFALEGRREFVAALARGLGAPPAPHELRRFEDGEHKARPLEGVRGADVYVVASLHGDEARSVNDKLCELLFFAATLRDAGAARVTALAPYLCYARKDRQTKPRDPVTTLYVARMMEAVGIDAVVTIDVHNLAAFQNAFRCLRFNLEARHLLADHLAPLLAGAEVTVMSPDPGGVKRADRFREALEGRLGRPAEAAFMEKRRSAGVVSGEALVGAVAGRAVVIVDDLVSSGTTLARAAAACRAAGATAVYGAVTHGLFTGDAGRVLSDAPLARLVVTDSVPSFRLEPGALGDRVSVVSVAGLCAEAIRRLHEEGSMTELLWSPHHRP